MDGGGSEKDMDPRFVGIFDRFPGPLDVFFFGPGQAADDRSFDLFRYLFDRIEVAGRSDGKTGFNDVDPLISRADGRCPVFLRG